MKNSLFDAESWLWKPFGYVADFLILSAIWLLCSVPIVTAGAAFAALYDCCARCVLGGEQELLTRFFRTFRRELKLGSGSFLLWAAVLGGGVLLISTFAANAAGTDLNVALAYAMAALLLFLTGVPAWVFPLLSRFTFTLGSLQTTALRLSLAQLPRTIALGLLNAACGWLCFRWVFPLLFLPAVTSLLSTFLLEPMFKPYLTEHS